MTLSYIGFIQLFIVGYPMKNSMEGVGCIEPDTGKLTTMFHYFSLKWEWILIDATQNNESIKKELLP